jgi:hypothetical protein
MISKRKYLKIQKERIEYAHRMSDSGKWSDDFFQGFIAGLKTYNEELDK